MAGLELRNRNERNTSGRRSSVTLGALRSSRTSEDAVTLLQSELQRVLGNRQVGELAARGPQSPAALYVSHLLDGARASNLDMRGFLPWHAAPSWTEWVQPYISVLWSERQRALEAGGTALDMPTSAPAVGPLGLGPIPSFVTEMGLGAPSVTDAGVTGADVTGAGVANAGVTGAGVTGADASIGAASVMRDARTTVAPAGDGFIEWFDRAMAQSGGGRAPTPAEQAVLRRVHGRTFPEARIHEGPSAQKAARAVNARAFTVGTDIYMGERTDVSSAAGAELLVHEATHVAQHLEGRLPAPKGDGLEVSDPASSHEREAEMRGQEARAIVGDPWGLGGCPASDPAARVIVQGMAQELPSPDTLPPADVVSAALMELRRLRGNVEGPLTAPDAGEVAALRGTVASYPMLGDAMTQTLGAAVSVGSAAADSAAADSAAADSAAVSSAAGAVMRKEETSEVSDSPTAINPEELRALIRGNMAAREDDLPEAGENQRDETEQAHAENAAQQEDNEQAVTQGTEAAGPTGEAAAPSSSSAPAGPAAPGPAPSTDSAPAASVGETAQDLAHAFVADTPTRKAETWKALGAGMAERGSSESESFQDGIPEFHARMTGEDASGGRASVATPSSGPMSQESVETTPEPEIAPTPQPEVAEVDAPTPWWGSSADQKDSARAIGDSLGSVPTADGDVQASPGPVPNVPLRGETDPQRLVNAASGVRDQASGALEAARQAVLDSPGAELVQPLQIDEVYDVERVTAPTIAATEQLSDMERYIELGLPADVQSAFDELNGPDMEANLTDARGKIDQATEQRDADQQRELDSARTEADRLNAEAQADQSAAVAEQRTAIEGERRRTMTAQASAVTDMQSRASAEQSRRSSEIQGRVTSAQSQVQSEYTRAETESQAEIDAGEAKAEAEKRKAEQESQNKSWWEKACDWVASAIDALCDAISAIFDVVRAAVTAIIDAAKEVAGAIIDAACSFICDVISAYGEFLKGAIQGLLGDVFPGLADALCGFVDTAVELAQEAVNYMAEKLKGAINTLLDKLGAVINAVLKVWQAAIEIALAVAEGIITGDWGKVLLKALEAALKLAGISPEEFYGLVGNAEETIELIVNDPGGFLGNCIDAAVMGFDQFSDNFLDHLQSGFVEWLTGAVGDAGLTMPDTLDMGGIFSIAAQALGLTRETLEDKVQARLGKAAGRALEIVWESVESYMEGGWEGLWEQLKGDLGSLWEDVVGTLQDWLLTKVAMAAVTKLASMFNPVGAIVQAIITMWNLYQFLKNQIDRIVGVLRAFVSGIGSIAAGEIGGAANRVEAALGDLVTVAIDLLARLVGLGGIGQKVRSVIEGVSDKIDKALDAMIDRIGGWLGFGTPESTTAESTTEGSDGAETSGSSGAETGGAGTGSAETTGAAPTGGGQTEGAPRSGSATEGGGGGAVSAKSKTGASAKTTAGEPSSEHDVSDFNVDKKKLKQLNAAIVSALSMAAKAAGKTRLGEADYMTWMDAEATTETTDAATRSRVAHVRTGYNAIKKCLEKDKVTFKKWELTDDDDFVYEDTYAYVYAGEEENNIYLGGAFWVANKEGLDSKAGTIVHELSHLLHDTEDHHYGPAESKSSAKDDPETATTNADNYAHFSESA